MRFFLLCDIKRESSLVWLPSYLQHTVSVSVSRCPKKKKVGPSCFVLHLIYIYTAPCNYSHAHIEHAKVYYPSTIFICACVCVCHGSPDAPFMCVFMGKPDRVCVSLQRSQCCRCEVGVGKVLYESFLGSVMVITRSHTKQTHTCTQLSGLDTTEEQK